MSESKPSAAAAHMGATNNKIYFFASNLLYDDKHEHIEVVPGALRVFDVQYAGVSNMMAADTWTFRLVDAQTDKRYVTHYNWALIEDTPENRALYQEWKSLHDQVDALKLKAALVHKELMTVSAPSKPSPH